jgi:hypothetical protein
VAKFVDQCVKYLEDLEETQIDKEPAKGMQGGERQDGAANHDTGSAPPEVKETVSSLARGLTVRTICPTPPKRVELCGEWRSGSRSYTTSIAKAVGYILEWLFMRF